MKTLEAHNHNAVAVYRVRNKLKPYTRIACPLCGEETTGDPHMVLASNPPCTWLDCPNDHRHVAILPVEWFLEAEPELCAHRAPIGDCSICVNTLRGSDEGCNPSIKPQGPTHVVPDPKKPIWCDPCGYEPDKCKNPNCGKPENDWPLVKCCCKEPL